MRKLLLALAILCGMQASQAASGHEGVQLWKGGPYWATMNCGATKPTEAGYYYLNNNDTVGYMVKNGALKGSLVKNSSNTLWGSGWRQPTTAEAQSMKANCKITGTGTDSNGQPYVVVSGTTSGYTDKSITIPLSGYGNGGSVSDGNRWGTYGKYWTSNSGIALRLAFTSTAIELANGGDIGHGNYYTIRLVSDTEPAGGSTTHTHTWGTPSYTWTQTSSGYDCKANVACTGDASHTSTKTVSATYTVVKAATSTAAGTGRYTATFSDAPFTTQTKDVSIPATSSSGGQTGGGSSASNPTPAYSSADYYVSTTGSDSNAGTSRDKPFLTIAKAVATAQDGQKICVMKGTYNVKAPGTMYKNTAAITVEKSVKIFGETGRPEDVIVHNSKDWVESGDYSICYRVFMLNNAGAVISGITVENGNAHGSGSDPKFFGANVFIDKAGGTVTNCIIRNGRSNTFAADVGKADPSTKGGVGGIACFSSSGLITHCVITNNFSSMGRTSTTQTVHDGGAAVYLSAGTLRESLIAYNTLTECWTGSAVYAAESADETTLIDHCTIVYNKYVQGPKIGNYSDAGQLYPIWIPLNTYDGSSRIPEIRNCLIYGNTTHNGSKALIDWAKYNDGQYSKAKKVAASNFVDCATEMTAPSGMTVMTASAADIDGLRPKAGTTLESKKVGCTWLLNGAASGSGSGETGGQDTPPAHTHSWGTATYAWSSDNKSCTATASCTVSGCSEKSTQTATSTYAVTTSPTATTDGSGRYTVAFTSPFTTQTKTVTLPKTGSGTGSSDGHDGVQLWKGGPYWATMNCGATKPTESGYYYLNNNDTIGYQVKNGALKGSLVKNSSNTLWGNGWRQPTTAEAQAMKSNCKVVRTGTDASGQPYVVIGGTTSGYTDKTITVPLGGYGNGGSVSDGNRWGTYGKYWTSNSGIALRLAFTTSAIELANGGDIGHGNYYMIRLVRDTAPAGGGSSHTHTWGTASYEWTQTASGWSCKASVKCTADSTHAQEQTVSAAYTVITAATTTSEGKGRYTATFSDSVFTVQTKDVTIPKIHEHVWGEPTYAWTGTTACQATAACSQCSEKKIESGKVSSSVTTEATCTTDGERTYKAIFTTFTATVKTETIPAGHAWNTPAYVWSADGSSCTATATCQRDAAHVETEQVTTTFVITVQPTTRRTGKGHLVAAFTKTPFTTQNGPDVELPKKDGGEMPDADYYVSFETGDDANEGIYESPLKTLACALGKARDGESICLLAGVHEVSQGHKTLTVSKAVTIFGETGDPSDVILRCVAPITNGYVTRVLILNNKDAVLESVSAEGGFVAKSGTADVGGNILIDENGGTVTNCIIRKGRLQNGGTNGSGAGIACRSADGLITHCVITNNTVLNGGFQGSVYSQTGAAGVFMDGGVLRDSLIAGNVVKDSANGTAVYLKGYLRATTMENCTLAGNRGLGQDVATNRFAALSVMVWTTADKNPLVRNCAFIANKDVRGDNVAMSLVGATSAAWVAGATSRFESCVTDGKVQTNDGLAECSFMTVAGDLKVVDAAGGDFRPASKDSPLVDAGAAMTSPADRDLAGNARVCGSSVDVGCYEFDAEAADDPEPDPEWDVPGATGGINALVNNMGRKFVRFTAISVVDGKLTLGLEAAKVNANGQVFGLVCKERLTDKETFTINVTLTDDGTGSATVGTLSGLTDKPSLFVLGIVAKE